MKKILITGAGGTVGLSLSKFLLSQGNEICAIDRSEDALAKLMEIKRESESKERFHIEFGDVLDARFIEEILCKYEVNIVIHCASLKHVSTGYCYPEKMAFENIVAFSNIMKVVRNCNFIERVILCSSDKAAQSSSTMGASKRFLEILGENANIPHIKFIAIRFGNILHSNGSLTDVIEKKIVENKPVTIRDKRMTRYMLTAQNVIDLTMFAIENGGHGDICSIETPSAKVIDIITGFLAKQKSRIPILYGENDMNEAIHESLFNNVEINYVSRNGHFFVYNKNKIGNLSKRDKEYLTSSNYSPIDNPPFQKFYDAF